MNNIKYSKCKKCNQDEKYSVWVVNDGKTEEVKCCSKQCMLSKDKK